MLWQFFTKKPLLLQVDYYYRWKALRYPEAALSHRRLLKEFYLSFKLHSVIDIQQEHIWAFAVKQNSQYYQQACLKTLHEFLKYARMVGYLETIDFSFKMPTAKTPAIERVHANLHVDQVLRVKQLRDSQKLSFRAIKVRMETEDRRKYDLKNLHRWYHHQLPAGF